MTRETSPAQAATTAAEGIRSLNHATVSGTGYAWPSDVYDVLTALTRAAQMLPQALDQAARWLEGQHDAGQVGHDRHARFLTAEVYDTLACVEDARAAADALAVALSAAAGHTGHLTGRAS